MWHFVVYPIYLFCLLFFRLAVCCWSTSVSVLMGLVPNEHLLIVELHRHRAFLPTRIIACFHALSIRFVYKKSEETVTRTNHFVITFLVHSAAHRVILCIQREKPLDQKGISSPAESGTR
jgi:hypothetical protein